MDKYKQIENANRLKKIEILHTHLNGLSIDEFQAEEGTRTKKKLYDLIFECESFNKEFEHELN
jgi:hypothetical protein